MQDSSTIKFTAKAYREATLAQLKAISDAIAAEGCWDAYPYDITIFWDFGGTLMVSGLPGIVLGIEPDGYTHS